MMDEVNMAKTKKMSSVVEGEEREIDEAGPFVKVEYRRGRRATGLRERLAEKRALAIEDCVQRLTAEEGDMAVTENDLQESLARSYTEQLRKGNLNDSNKKRSLKGKMLELTRERLEALGYRIIGGVTGEERAACTTKEPLAEEGDRAGRTLARLTELEEMVLLGKEAFKLLIARVSELETKVKVLEGRQGQQREQQEQRLDHEETQRQRRQGQQLQELQEQQRQPQLQQHCVKNQQHEHQEGQQGQQQEHQRQREQLQEIQKQQQRQPQQHCVKNQQQQHQEESSHRQVQQQQQRQQQQQQHQISHYQQRGQHKQEGNRQGNGQEPQHHQQGLREKKTYAGVVRGNLGGNQASLCSRTLWGVEGHYSLELVECLLCDIGVNTSGMKLTRVLRTGRGGKRLGYVSIVGTAEAMHSLDSHREAIARRGWRVGWGDRAALGNDMGGWGLLRLPTPYLRVW